MAGARGFEVGLQPVPTSARTARSWIHEALSAAGLEAHEDRLALIASELVNNVVVHAGTTLTLAITVHDDRIHLEVEDRSSDLPEPALPVRLDSESGRGLLIVESLADRWGVYRDGDEKLVWCELDVGSKQTATRR